LTHQAPAEMDMSADWLWEQLSEAIQCGHKWESLNLHGGEPILHPDYIGIAKAVLWYRDNCGHTCHLACFSNGLEAGRLKEVSDMGIVISRSPKAAEMAYVPVCHTPDNMPYVIDGCYMSSECGMALNINGYFPCSAMAAAARVWVYESSVQHPQDITELELVKLRSQHCTHCGFAVTQPRVTKDLISQDWSDKLAEYCKSKTSSQECSNQ
jgi:hypothetical protein